MSTNSEVLGITNSRAIIDCGKAVSFLPIFDFYSYYSLIFCLIEPVSIMGNNKGTNCRPKDSKHYFKYFFI